MSAVWRSRRTGMFPILLIHSYSICMFVLHGTCYRTTLCPATRSAVRLPLTQLAGASIRGIRGNGGEQVHSRHGDGLSWKPDYKANGIDGCSCQMYPRLALIIFQIEQNKRPRQFTTSFTRVHTTKPAPGKKQDGTGSSSQWRCDPGYPLAC